jgi:hypothetical protein
VTPDDSVSSVMVHRLPATMFSYEEDFILVWFEHGVIAEVLGSDPDEVRAVAESVEFVSEGGGRQTTDVV